MKKERRQQGVLEVETIQHPRSGLRTAIKLEKKTGRFRARVGETSLESGDLAELRERVKAEQDATVRLEWCPVILVYLDAETSGAIIQGRYSSSGARVGFSFQRLEIALKVDGTSKLMRPFLNENGLSDYDRERIAQVGRTWGPGRGQDTRETTIEENQSRRENGRDIEDFWGGREDFVLIDYTEERWDALHELAGACERARARLVDMLSPDKAAATLDTAGLAGLLGPGTPPTPVTERGPGGGND